jgi:hypothetical protein
MVHSAEAGKHGRPSPIRGSGCRDEAACRRSLRSTHCEGADRRGAAARDRWAPSSRTPSREARRGGRLREPRAGIPLVGLDQRAPNRDRALTRRGDRWCPHAIARLVALSPAVLDRFRCGPAPPGDGGRRREARGDNRGLSAPTGLRGRRNTKTLPRRGYASLSKVATRFRRLDRRARKGQPGREDDQRLAVADCHAPAATPHGSEEARSDERLPVGDGRTAATVHPFLNTPSGWVRTGRWFRRPGEPKRSTR